MFDRKTYMKKYFREHRGIWDRSRLQRNLKSLYGLTVEQYKQMQKDQDNKCLICSRDSSICRQRLNVDHCHKTGEIRGLLCGPCNAALGIFQDNIEILRKAIAYLEYNSSKSVHRV